VIFIQIDSTLNLTDQSFELYNKLLTRAAERVLIYLNRDLTYEATIVLTNDGQIQELNKQFRDQDRPTDVLAFPAGDPDPDTNILYLGDVVISFSRAKEQAKLI
jgi:probable rRNA maturation factor